MITLSTPSMAPNLAREPLFIVSPHLDDAVFSCGTLLAAHPGSIVCTVFCGVPVPPQQREWDRLAGHCDSSVAMRARFAEDDRALAVLAAGAIRLPFLDGQYGAPPTVEALVHALTDAWRQAGCPRLVVPIGIYHSDHVLVGDACRMLLRSVRPLDAFCYEDALYRAMRRVKRERYAAIVCEGWRVSPLDDLTAASLQRPGAANAKWRAVHAYRSQLRALDDAHPHDLAEPERYVVIDQPALARPSRR